MEFSSGIRLSIYFLTFPALITFFLFQCFQMGMLKKVLIVDDDLFLRVLTKEIVMDVGITDICLEASNGDEALNYLLEICGARTECPELILLDNKMPEVDGLEFYG